MFDEAGVLMREVSATYGAAGEVLTTNGTNEKSSQSYDGLYRVKTLQDGKGNTTSYSYDNLGQLTKISLPGADGSSAKDTIRFVDYDVTGRLKQRVDGNGIVSNYLYNDVEGALTNISYPSQASENITYSYDAYGLPQSVSDRSGLHEYSFNASDVLDGVRTTYKKADGTTLPQVTIGYSYNADGSRAQMTTPSGNFAYAYDGLGRAQNVTNPQGEATAWSYLDNNWLKTQQLANGAKTTFTYNPLGQMTGLTNRNGANAILSQFGHDGVVDSMLIRNGEGSVTQVKALLASASNLGGTTNYSYDVKSQLLGESSTRGSAISDTFNYDNAGNPTTWNLNAQSLTRTFNSNNQETTLNAGGSAQFDYDGNGNPTLYKNVATGFDVANHLTSYGTTFSAGYRSDGKRAWKQNSSGTRTYFLYDGDAIVAELDGNGAVTFTNTWGANGLISRRDESASSTRFYLWDERGSAAQRLDSSGAVIGSYSFTAWGKRSGGTGGDPYTGFGGQYGYYTDYETGLILCTHRYYDPNNGRWLTRDPIGYDGGINLYGYVGNDPTGFLDPSGLTYGVDLAINLGSIYLGTQAFRQDWNEGNGWGVALDTTGIIWDTVALFVPGDPGEAGLAIQGVRMAVRAREAERTFVGGAGIVILMAKSTGRGGKQPKLRSLETDPCQPKHIRGWITQEKNAIKAGKRKTIRNPPGYQLAHRRGFEAKKGFGYANSDPQHIDLHKLQHRYEGY